MSCFWVEFKLFQCHLTLHDFLDQTLTVILKISGVHFARNPWEEMQVASTSSLQIFTCLYVAQRTHINSCKYIITSIYIVSYILHSCIVYNITQLSDQERKILGPEPPKPEKFYNPFHSAQDVLCHANTPQDYHQPRRRTWPYVAAGHKGTTPDNNGSGYDWSTKVV